MYLYCCELYIHTGRCRLQTPTTQSWQWKLWQLVVPACKWKCKRQARADEAGWLLLSCAKKELNRSRSSCRGRMRHEVAPWMPGAWGPGRCQGRGWGQGWPSGPGAGRCSVSESVSVSGPGPAVARADQAGIGAQTLPGLRPAPRPAAGLLVGGAAAKMPRGPRDSPAPGRVAVAGGPGSQNTRSRHDLF